MTRGENIYSGPANPNIEQDRARMRKFEVPNIASKLFIGKIIQPGDVLLDLGSDNNPGLEEFVYLSGGRYIALDYGADTFDTEPRVNDAVIGDVTLTPIREGSATFVHERFVLAHLDAENGQREQAVHEAVAALNPDEFGAAFLIDYDWTTMSGSENMTAFREFVLEHYKVFDPYFGAYSKDFIQDVLGDDYLVEQEGYTPPKQTNYGPAIGLRGGGHQMLYTQDSPQELHDEFDAIMDAIDQEGAGDNPPGFFMPDIVCVKVSKI